MPHHRPWYNRVCLTSYQRRRANPHQIDACSRWQFRVKNPPHQAGHCVIWTISLRTNCAPNWLAARPFVRWPFAFGFVAGRGSVLLPTLDNRGIGVSARRGFRCILASLWVVTARAVVGSWRVIFFFILHYGANAMRSTRCASWPR